MSPYIAPAADSQEEKDVNDWKFSPVKKTESAMMEKLKLKGYSISIWRIFSHGIVAVNFLSPRAEQEDVNLNGREIEPGPTDD